MNDLIFFNSKQKSSVLLIFFFNSVVFSYLLLKNGISENKIIQHEWQWLARRKMRYIHLLLLLMVSNLIYSQHYGEYPLIEKELLLRDLELLHQGLDRYHTGMYWYTPKDSVELAFEGAKKAITTDLNVLAFHKIITPLIALSREDHTNVFLPNTTKARMREQAKLFPGSVVFLDRELYLVRNGSVEDAINEGDKILSINGQAIDSIVKNIGSMLASDGYIQSVKYSDLRGFGFSRYYYYYYGNVNHFTLKLENGRQVELEPLTVEMINKNLAVKYQTEQKNSRSRELLEFEVINDSTAYLGIHTFSNSDLRENTTHKKLAPFLENSFQIILEKNIQHLIIDLAKNSGGDEGNENLVYSYLGENYQKYKSVRAKTQKTILDNGIDKPIKLKTFGFFERVFANKKMKDGSYERKENIGFGLKAYKKEPKYKFNGSFYVLISPLTYSGGSELSNMIYSNDLGIFLGEETGGGYYGNTSGYSERLSLPHTQIMVDIPALRFEMNVNDRIPFGRGVIPHYKVTPTFEEYIKGENAALNFALKLIQKKE